MVDQSKDVAPAKAGTPAPASAGRHPLTSLRDEMDRLFDSFASSFGTFPLGRRMFDLEPLHRIHKSLGVAAPAVDVAEHDGAYEITAELPGMDEKDVELTLDDDVLTIKGEKKQETEEKKKDYYLSERHYGAFQRSFRMPEGADLEKVSASFRNGVLSITVPKRAGAPKTQRRIDVNAG